MKKLKLIPDATSEEFMNMCKERGESPATKWCPIANFKCPFKKHCSQIEKNDWDKFFGIKEDE